MREKQRRVKLMGCAKGGMPAPRSEATKALERRATTP